MRTTRSHAAALAALVLGAVVAPGCDRPAGVSAETKPASPPAPVAARVSAATPERATIRRTTEQPGQIEAAETTPIYAKIVGYVAHVAVDIGDRVKKGQVLAEIHAPEAEADSRRAKAAVRQAEAGRRQAEAAIEVAEAVVASAEAGVKEIQAGVRTSDAEVGRWRSESSRVEQLTRERALTGSLLDETRSKLLAAESGREEAKAKVQSAEAALDEARAHLDKARSDLDAASSRIDVARHEAERAEAMVGYRAIVAPFDGIVTRRGIDTGHLTTQGTAGEPLFVLARSDVVSITVGVPEADAPLVNAGDPARVRLQALAGRTFEGKVARTSWSLDPTTRTLRAEIDLPNPDDVLRPGLYAYATIVAEEHPGALTVPASAVIAEGGKTSCVVVAGGQARRKEIKLGLSDGKRVEVVSGLAEGDRVVERDAGSLADGQPVEENPPRPGSPPAKS